MATDARISTALPSHPKTKKLARRLGPAGPLGCIYLFLWVATNRSDGDLAGMTDEDIELAIDWAGDEGAFVAAMTDVGFLEGAPGARRVHDWAEHNPWAAGADARSEKSRWAALCKQHGRNEAARQMPEYAQRIGFASQPSATGMPDAVPESSTGTPLAETGSAPSPFPSVSFPSPSPSPSPTPSCETPAQLDEVDEGPTLPTMAGAVCITLRAKGVQSVNPSHPDLIALLERGVDIGAFAAAADKAVRAGKGSMAYVLAVVKGQVADSHRMAANARASPPPAGRLDRQLETAALLTGAPTAKPKPIEAIDVESRILPA